MEPVSLKPSRRAAKEVAITLQRFAKGGSKKLIKQTSKGLSSSAQVSLGVVEIRIPAQNTIPYDVAQDWFCMEHAMTILQGRCSKDLKLLDL